MFKIDWPCAIGGVVLGYYTKGKVTAAKEKFCGICTKAVENLKESFSEDYQPTQASQGTQGTGTKGGKNGN